MLCVVLHYFYVIYVVHIYRIGTGRFPELEPEGSQSRVYGPTELKPRVANMCYVWYFGELTKLCAYSVGVICFRY